MNANDLVERINEIIRNAVERAGGDKMQPFYKEVAQIGALYEAFLNNNEKTK